MIDRPIVPVFYHADLATCQQVLGACYAGGARVFEFTNRGEYAHEVFGELVKWARTELPEMILGIGSVLDSATAALYLQLGANFVVAPTLDPDTARTCHRRGVAWLPGCGSVTEISEALALGAEVVKIFPASQVGGPAFIKAVKGPMPWVRIMPTGGVTPDPENLQTWFAAGATCVGLGSQLFAQLPDGSYDLEEIARKVKESLDTIG